MLIYLHGYGSSGLSSKARHYQKLLGREQVYAPSLPADSRLALDSLQQLIPFLSDRPLGLIGSSLGGFWAVYLAERFNLPAVLLNPAIPPWTQLTLEQAEAELTRPGYFQWQPEMLQRLAAYRVKTPSDALLKRLCLIQQLDDEVLNPQHALDYFAQAQVLTGQGGGHRLTNVAEYDQQVITFFEKQGVLNAKIAPN